jgi:Fe-S-cluster containining protein
MKKKNTPRKKPRPKCARCGQRCCRYITVKIPAPRTIRDYDGLLWHLSHENVEAFKDSGGWHLLVYNPCTHLDGDGKCAIYENRPITCREHSSEVCEYDGSIAESASAYFDGPEALASFCRKKFKTWDRRY